MATVTFNRPDRRNAISSDLAATVRPWLSRLCADPTVGCIVLTGTDPAFCAGLDLAELRSTGHSPVGAGALIREVASATVPIVAAVNGAAYTGGLEIALGCDFILASDRAVFADTHAARGLMPGGGMSYRLTEAVGVMWAKRISFTGAPIDARTALRIGLAGEVVPHTELLSAAIELATAIAAGPVRGVRAMKQLYRSAIGSSVDDGIHSEEQAKARWFAE